MPSSVLSYKHLILLFRLPLISNRQIRRNVCYKTLFRWISNSDIYENFDFLVDRQPEQLDFSARELQTIIFQCACNNTKRWKALSCERRSARSEATPAMIPLPLPLPYHILLFAGYYCLYIFDCCCCYSRFSWCFVEFHLSLMVVFIKLPSCGFFFAVSLVYLFICCYLEFQVIAVGCVFVA